MTDGVTRRAGAITLGQLVGRIETLRVTCSKCERAGQYSVARLIERHGAMALPDRKDAITADCPRRARPGGTWDICGAHFPDLPALMSQPTTATGRYLLTPGDSYPLSGLRNRTARVRLIRIGSFAGRQ